MLGGVTSFSVTVKVQVEVFPLLSLPVSVMVCVALWPVNVVPNGFCVAAELGLQLSVKLVGA